MKIDNTTALLNLRIDLLNGCWEACWESEKDAA